MGNESYIYQMPNGTDTSDYLEYFKWVNVASDGLFMPVMYFVVYVVIFVTTLFISKPSIALTTASFICGVMAIILSTLGLLAPAYMYLTIFLFAVGIFWLTIESRR